MVQHIPNIFAQNTITDQLINEVSVLLPRKQFPSSKAFRTYIPTSEASKTPLKENLTN